MREAEWDLLCLGGATATGKSAVALVLAERLGGEIVSVDSMQVYKRMDIGTDKPGPEDRARVPHHMIDVVEPWEPFDVAQYVEMARRCIEEIRRRGKVAILCGGTGLYFKGLLYGLDPVPKADPSLRQQLKEEPLEKLLEELRQADPVMYEQIDRNNPRRVRRAIEILRQTGRPPSTLRTRWKGPLPVPYPFFGLRRSRSDLRKRIDRRVERMFERGLVEEAKALLEAGLLLDMPAAQALGYRQVFEYLQGKRSLEETKHLIKIRTAQFAKRQETWFRRQLPVEWIPVEAEESPEEIAEKILQRLVEGPQSHQKVVSS